MTTILAAGILYIRQNGVNIEYSSSSTFSPVTVVTAWPVTVTNTAPTSYLKVYFTTDITLTGGADRFFICGSEYLQFGNTTLNSDGTRPLVTIQNVVNYPGLIRNGTSGSDGYTNIAIVNLNILSEGTSSLLSGGGWVGQQYFSKGVTDNIIVNCSSNGNISEGSGGIIGQQAANPSGNVLLYYCNSSGTIDYTAGGIIGQQAGAGAAILSGGTVSAINCFSTGNMIGIGSAGGIFGLSASRNTSANKCYSTGTILDRGGGIFTQGSTGNATACYSRGQIGGTVNAGGIFGTVNTSGATATNCYSSGNINATNGGGGIFARPFFGPVGITYSYTSGSLAIGAGGIYADSLIDGATNYSEGNNGNSGTWSSTNANTVLQGVGTIWGSIAPNTPYILLNFGISPYRLDVIDPATYALNQTFSQTVQAGQTTIPAQVAGFKTFQILTGGHPSITIDNTGVITTTSATPAGTYNLMIYAVDDYTTTIVSLTVTGLPEPIPITVPASSVAPCCQGPICVQASPTTDKDNELLTTYTSGQAIVNNVDRYYTDIKTGARTFFVKPVFGSYREYMNYLQTKNRYI
jgi:hypothetical protein